MGRNIWIGIVVVIVLAVGAWWYLSQSNTPTTLNTTPSPTEQTTQQNTNAIAPTSQSTNNSGATATIDPSSLVSSSDSFVISGTYASSVTQSNVTPTIVVLSSNYSGATDWNTITKLLPPTPNSGYFGAYSSTFNTGLVVNGNWKTSINNLPKGTYEVLVYSGEKQPQLLTTATLSATQAKTSATLSATPSSGKGPLAVTFNGVLSTSNPSASGGLGVDEPYITFGDSDQRGTPVSCDNTPYDTTNYVYPTSCTFISVSHTYAEPGTYTATLHLGEQKGTQTTLGTVTITVQ